MSRLAVLLLLLAACGDDGEDLVPDGGQPDAAVITRPERLSQAEDPALE